MDQDNDKKNYDFFGYRKKTTIVPLGYDKNIFFLCHQFRNFNLNNLLFNLDQIS